MSDNLPLLFEKVLVPAIKETLIMVGASTLFATILGFLLALVLIVTDKNGLRPNKVIYGVLDIIINVFRSFPFIILIIAILPFTKLIVGKSIGIEAAIVPLTVGAAPFIARIIESALNEVDKGVIEAAKSFGASDFQIIFKVILKEATPSIISGVTLAIISIVGYSAMAGVVGAGGLGTVAMTLGYQRFDNKIITYTVIILILMVQVIQSLGNYIYKRIK
ncbi:MAG: methionine ABC transporter permease [Clostridiaceae bacterium]